MTAETGDFWVFGYGSLMWNPGFSHRAAVPATLTGAHRSLCVYSYVHRGTPERPGMSYSIAGSPVASATAQKCW